jgi:flavin reductase (DIM6/NTAB) family NADH-FMN oxidoreductase RutF
VLGERPILYFGIPAVLISSEHEDGSINLAPMSSAFLAGMTLYFRARHNVKNDGKLETYWRVHAKLPSVEQVHAVSRLALTPTRGRRY